MKKTNDAKEVEAEFQATPKTLRKIQRRHIAAPGDADLRNCKVRITMYIDADILEYFKQRAAASNAAPYQTQINNALRDAMGRDFREKDYERLLSDNRFIDAVAKRVKKRMAG